jgi:hypothetical protein
MTEFSGASPEPSPGEADAEQGRNDLPDLPDLPDDWRRRIRNGREFILDGTTMRGELTHLQLAPYRLLRKFHTETDCGAEAMGGDHWAECEALVDALGLESWDQLDPEDAFP